MWQKGQDKALRYHLESRKQPSPDISPSRALVLDFPTSRTMRKYIYVLYELLSQTFCYSHESGLRQAPPPHATTLGMNVEGGANIQFIAFHPALPKSCLSHNTKCIHAFSKASKVSTCSSVSSKVSSIKSSNYHPYQTRVR
jgi:hypothetical protein